MNLKNLSKIKLIVFDIDGTIVNNNNDLTEYTIQTIMILRRRLPHIKLALATGRCYNTAWPVAKTLLHDEDYIIINNGAAITKIGHFAPEKEILMNRNDVKSFFEHTKNHDLHTVLFAGEARILIHNNALFKEQDLINQWISQFEIDHQEIPVDAHIYQCSTWVPYMKSASFFRTVYKNFDFELFHYPHKDFIYVEVTSPTVNKWAMISYLLEKYHLNKDEVLVFGNGNNDETMLASAGLGIAPANSDPEALAAADVIIEDNNNDGVAHFLEETFIPAVS